jgi:adenine-specific DNA methylase
MDESEKVIYVNLNYGVHYYSSRLEKMMSALETAGYDIVWNWGEGNLVNTSARIYQSSELSQEEVLGE